MLSVSGSNVTKNMIQVMDDQLKEILETETSTIVESNYSLFDDWWSKNIEEKSLLTDIFVGGKRLRPMIALALSGNVNVDKIALGPDGDILSIQKNNNSKMLYINGVPIIQIN